MLVPCLSAGPDGQLLAACGVPGCWIRLDESGFSGPNFPEMPQRIKATMDGDTVRFRIQAGPKLGKDASIFLGLAINASVAKMNSGESIVIECGGQTHSISAIDQHVHGRGWQCHFFTALDAGQAAVARDAEVVFPRRLVQQADFEGNVQLLVAKVDSEAPRLERFRFLPDGSFAYAGRENTLHWTPSLEERGDWEWTDWVNNATAIRDIAASETELLVGTRRGQLFRLDRNGDGQLLSDGLRITIDQENRDEIVCVAADKELSRAVVGKRNGELTHFNLQVSDKFQRETYRVHESPITSVAMTPDGEMLVSADDSGLLQFWQVSDTQLERSFELDTLTSAASKMRFTPDGSMLLILCRGESGIRILEVSKLQELFRTLGLK